MEKREKGPNTGELVQQIVDDFAIHELQHLA